MVKIKINKNDSKAFYLQIQEQIKDKIINGEIAPDTKIIPPIKWAPVIGVNFHTLNKALVNLAKEGFLYRRRNIGTLVKGKRIENKKNNLKLTKSKVLFLLPDADRFNYPYTQEVLKGINNRLSSYGIDLDIESFDKYKDPLLLRNIMDGKNVSGVIIDKEGFINMDLIKLIEDYKKKIVFINSYLSGYRRIPVVEMDNEGGIFIAAEYLVKCGHTKIAIILRSNVVSNPAFSYLTDASKLNGYKIALERYGIDINDKYIKESDYNNLARINSAVEGLLESKPLPTAILTADDIIGVEVLKILNQRGIKVPEDISVIGFNNFTHSQFSKPKLTTIETPMVDMGRKAAELLLDNGAGSKYFVLDVKLIERESVCRMDRRGQ